MAPSCERIFRASPREGGVAVNLNASPGVKETQTSNGDPPEAATCHYHSVRTAPVPHYDRLREEPSKLESGECRKRVPE